ncbi:MAG: 2-dehydropantoate 2-reductase [Bacteroidaceae bacterium]|nr:2-dehydropantoate 2-reductase [Bacteroidaceae bacterium]
MRYAVIGTGAIGGYYGAKLARSGQEVHFLLHSDYDFVSRNGLQVNSWKGDFHIDNPHIYNNVHAMPQCDVVLVALKTTNNHLLPDLLSPLLGPQTIVVLIQNGIGVEQDVQDMLPRAQLAAGLAFICSAKTRPGVVDHQHYGALTIANYSCRSLLAVERLVGELADAGIETHQAEYHFARWRKAVWNMPFNGMTVAMQCQTDRLLAESATRQLIRRQMLEVIHAAQALGIAGLHDDFADRMLADTDAMVPYSPSMRLDWDFRRPMELNYIYDRPLLLASQAGRPMTELQALADRLHAMEQQRAVHSSR